MNRDRGWPCAGPFFVLKEVHYETLQSPRRYRPSDPAPRTRTEGRMNLKEQLAIQALYKSTAPAKPVKAGKPRSTLGPVNAVSQKEEAQDETETPAPVKRRGRPRKVKD